MRTDLIYPASIEEPTIVGPGLSDNRRLHDGAESIKVNIGDPRGEAKESGKRALETALENLPGTQGESARP
jgi:hypothetical protein